MNEAALCVSEHLTDDADAIDLAMVMGAGWAPHRGGPLRYTDQRGLEEVVTMLAAGNPSSLTLPLSVAMLGRAIV